ARGTESEDKIEKRLQRYELELSKTDEFDIIIMNEDFNKAVRQFATSIDEKGE
ncbi:MAG: guanylate kinase, partial [Candidatus Marinimicrobia bacterium]|nr:guanylate kinase [Candidatus Neomarinimicrobiota bacterium]